MATKNTTFWEEIKSNKISIPIIQRDYAQGRENEGEKREKFLDAIFNHLSENKKLHLDFVYGRIKDSTFFPIDGQQRLTTLFLLHWYFALKENIPFDQKKILFQFVYDTRISSREFCQSLINAEIEIPVTVNDDELFKIIKNKYWFREKWNSDPTVKAMLRMIQAIHNKFNSINSSSIFIQLTQSDAISFELLDLGEKGFELTDELYIKMNSRGKQLTTFENFKANFIQLVDKNFKNKKLNHPIKGVISYSGYFSYKIEKEWTDLFWAFRGSKKTVDEAFYNYFEVITELLYFKKYKDAKAEDFKNSFVQYEDIYINKKFKVGSDELASDDENILFLFESLDVLHKIFGPHGNQDKENINNFFKKINNDISFFWNNENELNLFETVVNNGRVENVNNKIMFFTILHYLIKHDFSDINDEVLKYIRVVRNLIQSVRQRNDTKYNTNIRINNFGKYWSLFSQLSEIDVYKVIQDQSIINTETQISDESVKNEIEKAEILSRTNQNINNALIGLEELKEFGGLIHKLRPFVNESNLPEYFDAIKQIWNPNVSDTLKIQALIACGFDGLKIKNISMGMTYYFGRKGNWDVILTNDEVAISDSIISLLDKFVDLPTQKAEEKLKSIVEDWFFTNKTDRTYKYYFLKYPEFTSRLNYFVWPDDYEISLLGTEGSNPLLAFHINPYVLAICIQINDINICNEKKCYLQYFGDAPLKLENGITMISKQDGWLINGQGLINQYLIEKYNLQQKEGSFYLNDTIEKDRVEVAKEFCEEILRL